MNKNMILTFSNNYVCPACGGAITGEWVDNNVYMIGCCYNNNCPVMPQTFGRDLHNARLAWECLSGDLTRMKDAVQSGKILEGC